MSQHPGNDRVYACTFGPFLRAARLMGGLPEAVLVLFDAASRSGFSVKEGKVRVMLFCGDGTRVGGWNKQTEVWYVSSVIAEGHGALMRRHGFRFMDRTADEHRWWQRSGTDAADAFRSVCEALTGERISGN